MINRNLLKTTLLTVILLPLAAMAGEKKSPPPEYPLPVRAAELAEVQNQIHALQQQLIALQEKLEELNRRSAATVEPSTPMAVPVETAAVTIAIPSGTAATPQDPAQSIYGSQTPAAAGGGTVQIGGYGSFRYEANNINPTAPISNLPQVPRGFNSFDFRRFVMTLDARPTDRLRFYTEIEYERLKEIEIERTALAENRGSRDRAGVRFIQEVEGQSGSELAMEQAWLQYDFSDSFSARMGVVLPPVGRFNTNHDDNVWEAPRRSLVDRGGPVLPVKSAWSELGAGVLGNVPVGEGFLDYQFYIVNGAQLDFTLEEVVSLREGRNLVELEPEIAFASGPFNGTNTADAMTWRLGYTPRVGHEIALSGYHGDYTPDYLKVDSWINTLGIDGKTTVGGLEVEGEFIYSDFGRMERVLGDLALQAVDAAAATSSAETATLETEVEAEFAGPLTNQRYGYWVDFKHRFWPTALNDTFLGRNFENPQLVPFIRLEQIWFRDFVRSFDFSGGAVTNLTQENLAQHRTTAGIAYRPTPTVGFTIAWEYNRRTDGSTLIFPSTLGLGQVPQKSTHGLIIGSVFGF